MTFITFITAVSRKHLVHTFDLRIGDMCSHVWLMKRCLTLDCLIRSTVWIAHRFCYGNHNRINDMAIMPNVSLFFINRCITNDALHMISWSPVWLLFITFTAIYEIYLIWLKIKQKFRSIKIIASKVSFHQKLSTTINRFLNIFLLNNWIWC